MKTLSLPPDWMTIGCLIHAGLITTLWLLVFKLEVQVVSGKVWMVLAIAWLIWSVSAFLSSPAALRRRAVAGLIGILILAPTIPTLFTFIGWTLEGFAP